MRNPLAVRDPVRLEVGAWRNRDKTIKSQFGQEKGQVRKSHV